MVKRSIEIESEESWLHAAGVVHNSEYEGLSALVLSCYEIEKLLAELESEMPLHCTDKTVIRYSSLYTAWVCVLFESLRVMCKECRKVPGIKENISELEKIKKDIGNARGILAKLSEKTKNNRPSENQTTYYFLLGDGNLTQEIFENNVSIKEDVVINRWDISHKIVSVFTNCQVPESGRKWQQHIDNIREERAVFK